jgi:hypothetical protein
MDTVTSMVGVHQLANLLGEGEGVLAIDLREHDGELLAPVPSEQILAPDLLLHRRGQLLEHVVARQVPVGVVDLLEVVEVEHHQRQGPPVAVGAGDLALQGLEEVSLVGDLGQPVDGGEAVDLLVVGVLDVAAGQELEDGAAHLDEIAVPERVFVDGLVVDVGAVGRAEIADQDRLAGVDDLGVVAGDRLLVNLYIAFRRPPHDQRAGVEVVLLAELVSINHHQACFLAYRPLGDAADGGDHCLGPDVV